MKTPKNKCTKTSAELQAEIQWLEKLESQLVGISTTRYVPYKAIQNVHEALWETRLKFKEVNKPHLMKKNRKVVKL